MQRVDLLQRLLDVAHHDLGIPRVLPDVRIPGRRLRARGLADLHPCTGVDDHASGPGALDRAFEPLLQPDTVLDQDVGFRDLLKIGRRWFVVMRIDIGLEHTEHTHMRAADDLSEVGQLGRGRDDPNRSPISREASPTTPSTRRSPAE